ncbi:MAG: biotin--[acetyl-CoA-carboxylase] ligase [Gammaproteobacteria bacterium]|nr:biotin--[acetyl-CoA-carboxylase] ligase [Gammaproteobacteria bacterium]
MAWATEALRQQLDLLLPGLTVEVVASIGSTNTELLARAKRSPGQIQPCLLVAEQQTQGRGRQGKGWQSSAGASLTFSLALALAPADWSGLSLAVGLALTEAIDPPRPGQPNRLGIKWPNDLWFGERKLGGILVELRAEAGGPGHVVIGIGLNLRLSSASRTAIERLGTSAADLLECGVDVAARNALAARVIARCVEGLKVFGNAGFAPFFAPWRATDALRGRRVRVGETGREIEGVARGIDAEGALLVENAIGERVRVIAGEVSVRPAGAA